MSDSSLRYVASTTSVYSQDRSRVQQVKGLAQISKKMNIGLEAKIPKLVDKVKMLK
jgi:hypothetical protein